MPLPIALYLNGIVVTTPGPAAAVYATVNAAGCDSITTLNLSVQLPSNQSLTMSGCGSVVINGHSYTRIPDRERYYYQQHRLRQPVPYHQCGGSPR